MNNENENVGGKKRSLQWVTVFQGFQRTRFAYLKSRYVYPM